MKNRMFLGLGLAFLAVAAVVAAEGVKLEGVKCIMAASKDAKEANAVEYRGAKVFFCCQNCPKAFSKDVAKHAAKANHQLVATNQAKQIACPLSGKDLNPDTKVTVNGVDVTFCCNNCKGAVEGSKDQLEMAFGDKAFDKGFKVTK
ncbi:hypothetical protein ETAA8_26260 [Anatilimnocola aggregata]|uniref:C2H2-type domain-containing protein n=1 Tax=Anatilimnocola aggregata TaxID=2528021 RepID=A0A517YBC6_9BACT|nr:hypothetical protein [Anatilimnocola aggregata]QDU27538.1 hypothetical protein ETAA8_26260 [Anatilimnocola aggregata]